MSVDVFLEKVYNEINDNIKFLEAKNAALITLNCALIVLCGEIVFNVTISFFYRALMASLLLLLVVPLGCSIFSFRAKTGAEGKVLNGIYASLDSKNKISLSSKKYMYFAYIHRFFSDNPLKYWESISQNEELNAKKMLSYQVVNQIVDLSSVAYHKSALFNIAIRIELIIFGIYVIGAFIILIIKCLECF